MMNASMKTVMIFLLLLGCSQQRVWKDPGELTPMGAKISKEGSKRSVGSLRRLALAPVNYLYFSDADERSPALEKQYKSALLSEAVTLVGAKGYTVTPLYIYDDIIPEKFNISPEEFREHLVLLTDWAKKSSDGEEPRAEIISAVAKIGRPLNMDGLLVVQGSTTEPSRSAFWGSVMLTGPFFELAWLLNRIYTDLRADIYDVSTGRIVWRGQWSDSVDYIHPPNVSLKELFAGLEAADSKTTEAQ